MRTPPDNESTHERLNRELDRMRMRDVGFWGGWAVLIITVVVFGFFSLNTVTNVRFVTGVAGDTMPLNAEDGMLLIMQVEVEDTVRQIKLPSQLVHPARDDTICLRAGEHRFTGHTSYMIVSDSLCDAPSATPDVD